VGETSPGTVLITGPTGGLGRSATMAMATRPEGERPDLLLVGRAGPALTELAASARAAGATVSEIGCDLASLAGVRAATGTVKQVLRSGAVRPLHALIANAGLSVVDTRTASADGYELTFAVNYLAHAQLIGDLLDSLAPPARIVLLGSNTYYANWVRRLMAVPAAQWTDPLDLAKPAGPDVSPTLKAAGVAYSNSKLAILYYAHELQRHAPEGIGVSVFEPGFMPGTGLSRQHHPGVQRMGRGLQRLPVPGVASPVRSGPALASVALDQRWAHLRGGRFVVIDSERDVIPFADDPSRERRLWDATAELLQAASSGHRAGSRGPVSPPG
jgi:NAD(P)-dependent dehydrogenase (short-subunit alcohol dehydrogenase family)